MLLLPFHPQSPAASHVEAPLCLRQALQGGLVAQALAPAQGLKFLELTQESWGKPGEKIGRLYGNIWDYMPGHGDIF